MSDTAIKVENLKKQYKLGAIGGQTLNAELQSWWARKRGKEDPNLKIGQDYTDANKTFWALNGINLEVKKGEALGIIGANGAGKSTLLKILSRVTAPTEGDIWINGRIASMLEVGTGFHQELTGRENIYMNGAILGMSKREVDSKIESIIDFSECRQFIDTPVKRYSSGMYVKLAFAVASHLDSEILVMDEVLAVGDMKFQKKCLGKMGDVAENEGKTVLYVSHNMATIRNLCERCIVLDKGQVIFSGDVDEAISIYLKQEGEEYRKYYDLLDVPRVHSDFGMDVRLQSVEFENCASPAFSQSEDVFLSVKTQVRECKDNVRFFLQIYRGDTGEAVGALISEAVNLEAGENKSSFSLSFSTLAEGSYYFEIVALHLLPSGQHTTYDRTKVHVGFKVLKAKDYHNLLWSRNIYGSVMLPDMKKVIL